MQSNFIYEDHEDELDGPSEEGKFENIQKSEHMLKYWELSFHKKNTCFIWQKSV